MRNVIRNILQHFLRFDKRKQGSCCFRKTGLRVQGHGFYWRRSESGTKFPTGQFDNLSHSGDYVLCSIDTDAREGVQLGCDIEKVQKARMELAKRFFLPQ